MRHHHSIDLYRHWVSSGHYSAVLFDGSLLQLTFEYAGPVLVGHRFAYIPAPAVVEPELLELMPILDVVDDALSDPSLLRLATAVRVEFDPLNARDDHPAAHLSFNDQGCRIPCVTPMRLGMFLSLVFHQFYSYLWAEHEYLQQLPAGAGGARTINESEAAGLHLAWRM